MTPGHCRNTAMPRTEDEDWVGQAVALAQDLGGELDSVLLTHYPDAETLDTLRPGAPELAPDLAVVTAATRAVARELAAQGVEIFVQIADRAAFRRWMQGREDTPETRRGWIDRGRLLRGAPAFRALGLDAPPAPKPQAFAKAPGPIADRLLAGFEAEDGGAFDDLAQALLAAGRQDVLDLALRKIATRHGDEAAEDLEGALLAAAEAAKLGPSGWAQVVALPVALPAARPPDAAAMGESLVAAGILPDSLEVRFLPGWRSPDAVADLSPLAVRRVLLDLLAGAEPTDLPPGDTDDLAQRGFGVLVGLQVDWSLPVWEAIVVAGDLPPEPEEDAETPEDARRAELFDRWRGATFEACEGCVPLAVVPLSEVDAEIADFLGEAGEQAGSLAEIRDFVAMARDEAGGEEVVCRPELLGDALELSLYTTGGRFLDSMTLAADRLPARAEEMPRLIEGFVRVVRDTPGG
jgi:hypothetical protein